MKFLRSIAGGSALVSAALFLVLIAITPSRPGALKFRQGTRRTELAWTGKYLAPLPDEDDLGQNGEDRLDSAADDALQLCDEVAGSEGGKIHCVHRVVPAEYTGGRRVPNDWSQDHMSRALNKIIEQFRPDTSIMDDSQTRVVKVPKYQATFAAQRGQSLLGADLDPAEYLSPRATATRRQVLLQESKRGGADRRGMARGRMQAMWDVMPTITVAEPQSQFGQVSVDPLSASVPYATFAAYPPPLAYYSVPLSAYGIPPTRQNIGPAQIGTFLPDGKADGAKQNSKSKKGTNSEEIPEAPLDSFPEAHIESKDGNTYTVSVEKHADCMGTTVWSGTMTIKGDDNGCVY